MSPNFCLFKEKNVGSGYGGINKYSKKKKKANIARLPMDFFRKTAREWHHFHEMIQPPGGTDGKESACNAGDLGSIPGLGRSPGGGHGNPLQYYCLQNPWTEEPGGLEFMGLQRVGRD